MVFLRVVENVFFVFDGRLVDVKFGKEKFVKDFRISSEDVRMDENSLFADSQFDVCSDAFLAALFDET